MNKSIIPLIIAVLCTITAKAASTYTVNVQDFNELTIKGGLNVVYRCSPDSSGLATFSSTPMIAQHLRFNNDGVKLKIELSDDKDIIDTLRGLPTITVYSSLLTKAENTGDSSLIIHNPHKELSLKLKLNGNGRIIARNVHVRTLEASIRAGKGEIMVYGKCGTAKLNLSGKGKIDAQRLISTSAKCSIFGNGEISCNVNGGDLTLQGISGSTVYYRGKPANIKNRATKVKLVNLDEADASKPQIYPLDPDDDPK